ncbi:MAG TPA: hypothetical protein VN673_00570 [Clostridia bacterium]|nr:hypothetical protein [Clostridia bacterium]
MKMHHACYGLTPFGIFICAVLAWIVSPGHKQVFAAVGLHGSASLSVQINEKIESVRRAGYPTSLKELELWESPPADCENAALLWTNAFAALVHPPFRKFKHWPELPIKEPLSEDLTRYLQELVSANSLARKRMHKASGVVLSRFILNRQPASRDDVEPQGFWNGPFFDDVYKASKVLLADAVLASTEKRPESSIQAIVCLLSLARALGQEPDELFQLESVSVLRLACRAVERTLSQNELTDAQLGQLQIAFRVVPRAGAAARAMAVERCYGIFRFQNWQERLLPVLKHRAEFDSEFLRDIGGVRALARYYSRIRDADFLFYLESMEALVEASGQGYPQCIEAASGVASRLEEQRANGVRLLYSEWSFTYALKHSALIATAVPALARNAETAMAVERYRRAHNGKLPSSVSALVPTYMESSPLDPCDGAPLRLEERPHGGYRVYGAAAIKVKGLNPGFICEPCK